MLISSAKSFPLIAGCQVFIRRQPVRRCGADGQQIEAADRCRGELLPVGTCGAAAGLGQVTAEPRNELGGLPQQWREMGSRAGVGLSVKGEN